MNNASELHQRKYWQYVSRLILTEINNDSRIKKVKITTHGYVVHYFHLRIEFIK